MIFQDLEQIEEWNEYGELKDQIAATQATGSLTTNSASIIPEQPATSTTSSTPQRSGPPSRASSETRHISIFDPKDKEKDKDGGAGESASHKPTDSPINVALRQLGAEAAARAGQKKAAAAQAAKAAAAPTKEPSTTDQIPVPAATKLSAEAAVESPETATEVTAAKTPAQLAAEGAKRTSVDKIAGSEGDTTAPAAANEEPSSLASTEAQVLEQRRASSVTKTKSRLSESTPAAESETVLSEEAVSSPRLAVAEFEVSATQPPHFEGAPRKHRGSDIGEASPEEIRELEKELSIEEADDEDALDEEEDSDTEKKEKAQAKGVTSTDEAEQKATKGTEPQKTDAKDPDQAAVSVGD